VSAAKKLLDALKGRQPAPGSSSDPPGDPPPADMPIPEPAGTVALEPISPGPADGLARAIQAINALGVAVGRIDIVERVEQLRILLEDGKPPVLPDMIVNQIVVTPPPSPRFTCEILFNPETYVPESIAHPSLYEPPVRQDCLWIAANNLPNTTDHFCVGRCGRDREREVYGSRGRPVNVTSMGDSYEVHATVVPETKPMPPRPDYQTPDPDDFDEDNYENTRDDTLDERDIEDEDEE